MLCGLHTTNNKLEEGRRKITLQYNEVFREEAFKSDLQLKPDIHTKKGTFENMVHGGSKIKTTCRYFLTSLLFTFSSSILFQLPSLLGVVICGCHFFAENKA